MAIRTSLALVTVALALVINLLQITPAGAQTRPDGAPCRPTWQDIFWPEESTCRVAPATPTSQGPSGSNLVSGSVSTESALGANDNGSNENDGTNDHTSAQRSSGSRQNTSQGTSGKRTASFDGVTMRILSVDNDWRNPNPYGNHQGQRWITMDVQYDNHSGEMRRFSTSDFELVTENSVRWNGTFRREPSLSAGQLLPGSSVRGWVSFEVPRMANVMQLLWEYAFNSPIPVGL